jgi:hypothetical protein
VGHGRAEDVAGRAAVAGLGVSTARAALSGHRSRASIVAAAIILVAAGTPAAAEGQERCRVLCAPELKIEPTFTIENLFRAPIV